MSDYDPCIIITEKTRKISLENKEQILIDFSEDNFIDNLLKVLFKKGIHHLMVEGGAKLFKSFLKLNYWDEAFVIQTQKILSHGIKAPNINAKIKSKQQLGTDEVIVIRNTNPA